ncbi:31161_t:CDS:2 [Gigaspora margarita]|uniref:31161_t:CDS:1 n=1 Tax=Gigaspora margarita TaxID=4874 RepID=A0ABN7UJX7_GIGMA|nr:31161_t:CDS:2 [Gigaspora margarita]
MVASVISGNTSNTSSAPTNAERSNNTNIQTYYNSENFGSTTRDNSYASLLFLGVILLSLNLENHG